MSDHVDARVRISQEPADIEWAAKRLGVPLDRVDYVRYELGNDGLQDASFVLKPEGPAWRPQFNPASVVGRLKPAERKELFRRARARGGVEQLLLFYGDIFSFSDLQKDLRVRERDEVLAVESVELAAERAHWDTGGGDVPLDEEQYDLDRLLANMESSPSAKMPPVCLRMFRRGVAAARRGNYERATLLCYEAMRRADGYPPPEHIDLASCGKAGRELIGWPCYDPLCKHSIG